MKVPFEEFLDKAVKKLPHKNHDEFLKEFLEKKTKNILGENYYSIPGGIPSDIKGIFEETMVQEPLKESQQEFSKEF